MKERIIGNDTLLALVKEPGKRPTVKIIDNTLRELQRAVGGHIEVVAYRDDYIMLVDEEGLLKCLPENILGIHGNIVLAREDGEDFAGLRGYDIPELMKELSE